MNNNEKISTKELIQRSGESFSKGEYIEAESLIREALRMGEEEGRLKDVASSFSNLGTILSKMGRYQEALKYYSKALAVKEEIGDKGPSVAATLNQLAQVYSAIGDIRYAETLYRKSLAIIEKIGDRSSEAITLSNLASVYMNQLRLSEAEALYLKALNIQESLDNWQRGKTYNNLGQLYFMLHDLGKARKTFEKSVELLTQHLGYTHPDTASVLNNLAFVLAEEGKDKEAEKLFRESLASLEKSLGVDHPYVKHLVEKKQTFTKGSSRHS